MLNFYKTLKQQRWDDHRYYHHSRINQSLHFISALSFLISYCLLLVDPIWASLVAWLIAMPTRQLGHFFFEPKEYDEVNNATHEYKEKIKVGYNLNRKIVLLSIWAFIPILVYVQPEFLNDFNNILKNENHDFLREVGYLWLLLGLAGVIFRTTQLIFIYDFEAALAWMVKIITDPFHDAKIYALAPIYLFRGQLIDPMEHIEFKKDEINLIN